MRKLNPAEIESVKNRLRTDFTYWYHRIELGHDIVTPGLPYEPLWNNVRKVRGTIDYKGKNVLDIASFDGMWAFEAEKLGARCVVATDCLYRTFRNFLFCKDVLGSTCVPYFNVSPYNLFERLDVYFQENYDSEKRYERMFDIVQHLGLLYHLRDPMLSLSQTRSCMKAGGTLLIETNVVLDCADSFMLYNGIPFTHRISDNYSVWWVPTINCLKEMLSATLFEPNDSSISIAEYTDPLKARVPKFPKRTHPGAPEKEYRYGRLCMTARALDAKEVQPDFLREMQRNFRNPGLVLDPV